MTESGARTPPGQRPIDHFPRIGPPRMMLWRPPAPPPLRVSVGGDVEALFEITAETLAALPRVEQRSDLHCVATWSRLGIRWGGWRFCDVYERVILPSARPRAEATWVRFRGLDGLAATLRLEDALAEDVLLADEMDGQPLDLDHGMPLRLVAPMHYGYKSIKHLAAIELGTEFRPTRIRLIGFREHPRGRVALEERGAGSAGWAVWTLRRLYRTALVPTLLRWFRRSGAR